MYKTAKVKHDGAFVVFYRKNAAQKVGFVASKKVGNAVKRNRAKRLLRAHFINHASHLETGSYIFVAKEKLLSSSFEKTRQRFTHALHSTGALEL